MAKTKLKPCPFCGGEITKMAVSHGTVGVVFCSQCRTKFVLPWNECETVNDMYEAWNRRCDNDQRKAD